MDSSFSEFDLHPLLLQAVSELEYHEPTPIQSAIIPLMLKGEDVIGQAQTGTGKTAAFALPVLHRLEDGLPQVQSLVLVPTRELALQVANAFTGFSKHRSASVLPVYGGQPYSQQINRLRRGVQVVVGTPGRILDLIEKKVLLLDQVRTVVLDEADEMLSMGFIEDIETILKATPPERQTALFSATMPPAIRRLADRYLRAPQAITLQHKQLTVESIEQRYYLVRQSDKLAALTRLFEVENISSALIFARTRAGTAALANELTARGFPVEVLNGDLTQETRERVLHRFRQNLVKVLVATDVAARGLDIEDISHVFNFDLPEDEELYVHRIGRTGRAGKAGIAISLITPAEQWRLRRIETFTRKKINQCEIPSEEDILKMREEQLVNRMSVWLQRARYKREREMVERLVQEGHDPLEIAAAALKLARADEKQRPIAAMGALPDPAAPAARRTERRSSRGFTTSGASHEAGMVRLTLSKGRAHGIRPNDVVSTIAFHANIPGNTIGKIRIQDQHTLVDVPEKFVPQVLAKTADYRFRRQPVEIEVSGSN